MHRLQLKRHTKSSQQEFEQVPERKKKKINWAVIITTFKRPREGLVINYICQFHFNSNLGKNFNLESQFWWENRRLLLDQKPTFEWPGLRSNPETSQLQSLMQPPLSHSTTATFNDTTGMHHDIETTLKQRLKRQNNESWTDLFLIIMSKLFVWFLHCFSYRACTK